MTLLHPTVGELLDRLAIVRLKFEATDDGQDKIRLGIEMKELELALDEKVFDPSDLPQFAELENVHARLWKVEDEIRAADPIRMSTVARLCTEQSKLNDHRAKLVREISERFGEHVAKKVYK